MPSGVSAPDPFILNDAVAISQGALPYRQTVGLTARSQAYNSGLKNLCLIVMGQSNGTSINPTLYTPSSSSVIDQMNLYDGGSYEINGPMLGSQLTAGQPGNVAARLAQNAITGAFDRVIVQNICIAGTTVADWATGTLADRIPVAMRRFRSRGYIPGNTGLTFAIQMLIGETDNTNGTAFAAYVASMNTISTNAQAAGFTGRIFVNKQTWNAGAVSATVQSAQTAFWPAFGQFVQGADLDTLNAASRQADNTHFNDAGAASAATLMWSSMHASGAPY